MLNIKHTRTFSFIVCLYVPAFRRIRSSLRSSRSTASWGMALNAAIAKTKKTWSATWPYLGTCAGGTWTPRDLRRKVPRSGQDRPPKNVNSIAPKYRTWPIWSLNRAATEGNTWCRARPLPNPRDRPASLHLLIRPCRSTRFPLQGKCP